MERSGGKQRRKVLSTLAYLNAVPTFGDEERFGMCEVESMAWRRDKRPRKNWSAATKRGKYAAGLAGRGEVKKLDHTRR